MNRPMKPCKHCGCTKFYTKERYKGYCEYYTDINEKIQCDNSGMYDYTEHTYVSKYYWCADCHKRGEKINE